MCATPGPCRPCLSNSKACGNHRHDALKSLGMESWWVGAKDNILGPYTRILQKPMETWQQSADWQQGLAVQSCLSAKRTGVAAGRQRILLQINTMLNVYKMMLRSQQMLHFSCANFCNQRHIITVSSSIYNLYGFIISISFRLQISTATTNLSFIYVQSLYTPFTITYHHLSSICIIFKYDAPTIPFSSWGWDPTSDIYFMTVWTHSSSCSARCIPWYVLNRYIEQSFDHKSCVESIYLKESHKKSTTIPSPRPSKVSASPCATVSLWKNPLVAVEVLFHWLKPPMEVRHEKWSHLDLVPSSLCILRHALLVSGLSWDTVIPKFIGPSLIEDDWKMAYDSLLRMIIPRLEVCHK